MFKKYFSLIQRLYDRQESGLALALFRIIYGLVLFAEVWQIFYFRHLLFDPVPYVQEAVSMITPMLIIWLSAIALLTFGLFTRSAVILNYLFTVLFLGFSFNFGSAAEHNYHIDKELIPVALLLLFMPVSRRLSFDRLIEKITYSTTTYEHLPKESVSSLNYIVLTLAAGLIYFDSIFYKFYSPMWLEGLGVWLPASLPWATYLDLSFILNNEYLVKFLGYLTLFFQLTYIFFVWIKKTKVFYLLIGIGLHVGIALAFPIPWFALAMVALYIGIIPSSFYSSIYTKVIQKPKRPTLTFYFDENCPLCNRLRIIVEYFDNGRSVSFVSAQSSAHKNDKLQNIPMQTLLDDVYSVDAKGVVYSGIDTYQQVIKRVWVLKPFALLFYLPFVKSIGAKIYGYIAQHRVIYGCNEETCGIPGAQPYIAPDDANVKLLQNLDLKSIKVFLLGTFILFLVVSQLIMIQNSLLMKHLYAKVGVSSGTLSTINNSANFYKKVFYPFTGLAQHAVFMDYHFQNYNHTVAIAYDDSKGNQTFLPIIDEKGQASFYDSGRQWVNYSFRVSNKNFNAERYAKGIQKYIYFWAHKNAIDLRNATFTVKYKYTPVPYKWEKDLLKSALNRPWKDAGTLGWKNGIFYADIIDIENHKQEE